MPTITFAHLDSAMRIVREPAEPPASEVIPIEQPPPALSAGAHNDGPSRDIGTFVRFGSSVLARSWGSLEDDHSRMRTS